MSGAAVGPSEPVLVEEDRRGVVRVTINRPHVRNAWDMPTVAELTRVFRGLADRAGRVRAVVVTGAGGAFSAGGDLNWMRGILDRPTAERRADAEAIAGLLELLDGLPVPVVARVNGPALGGGCGLVCAADVAVASEDARLGLGEVRIGVVPATIAPFVVRRIGVARVRGHLLSGAQLSAGQALGLGLVHHVVDAAGLDAAVEAVVVDFLRCAPEAVAETKGLLRAIERADPDTARGLTVESIVRVWEGEEAREGLSAFLAKRPPSWTA